jgi:FkbM family methyltransferase
MYEMSDLVHVFENGVKVYDHHITPKQRERYQNRNVHEAEEEDIFLEILQNIPDQGCYVNIGSAIGYYIILAKIKFPYLKVHAYEPLGLHKKFLMDNLKLNGLDQQQISLYSEGVSASVGEAWLVERGYGSRLSDEFFIGQSLRKKIKLAINKLLNEFRNKNEKMTRIQTISLGKLLARTGGQIDLLQMDVQGLEEEILISSREELESGRIRTFLVGTHGKDIHQRCLEIFKENGYEIEYELEDPDSQPDGIIVTSMGVRRLAG